MQWDASPDAGFGSGAAEPWLPLNSDYRVRNVAAQEGDAASMLSWYKSLLALRRSRASLREAPICFLNGPTEAGAIESVIAYERGVEGYGSPWDSPVAGKERTLVFLNFSAKSQTVTLEGPARVILASASLCRPARAPGLELPAGGLELGPYEALIAE